MLNDGVFSPKLLNINLKSKCLYLNYFQECWKRGGLGPSSISGKNYLGTKGKMCKAQSLSLAIANCLLDSAGRGMGLAVWQCSH